MISSLITLIIVLVIVALLIYGCDLLASRLPEPFITILKVLIILVAVLCLVQWLGVLPVWRGP